MNNNLSIIRKILSISGLISCGFIIFCLLIMFTAYVENIILVMTIFQFLLFLIYLSGVVSIFSKRYNTFLNKEMIKHKFMTAGEIIILTAGNINTFFSSYIIWDGVDLKNKNIMLIVLIVTTLLVLSNCILMVISRVRFIANRKKTAGNKGYNAYEDNLKENPNTAKNDNIVYLKKELYTTLIADDESNKKEW